MPGRIANPAATAAAGGHKNSPLSPSLPPPASALSGYLLLRIVSERASRACHGTQLI